MESGRAVALRELLRALERARDAGSRAAAVALQRLFESATVEIVDEPQARPAGEVVATTFLVSAPVDLRLALVALPVHARSLAGALAGADPAQWRGAFDEVANIVASAFLNGVAVLSKLRLVPSVPEAVELRGTDLVRELGATRTVATSRLSVRWHDRSAEALLIVAPTRGGLEALADSLDGKE